MCFKSSETSLDGPIADVLHFKDKDLISTLLLELNTLRKDQKFTDVVLCSEGKELPCHRNVLVSSSPYFYAMFCSCFLETQKPRIDLQGVPYDILASIVEYVYTGSIGITMEQVLPLMQAASMLQYGRLFEACSTFLQTQLSPDNCLSMIRLSEILHCSSLQEKARELAVKSFSDVAVSEDFCELSLPELVSYLEDDKLCVEEEQVFETLLAWIHHDPFSRCSTIHDLFRRVRLRHVHPSYLFQFIANDPFVQSSSLCIEIIESVRRLLFSVGTHCPGDLEPLWAVPRRKNCKEALVVVGGRKNGERTSREALLYDEQTRCWQCLAKIPLRLHRPSYVCMHSILYVLGGLTTTAGGQCTPTNTVYTLSLKTNQWRVGEPMLTPRYAHQSSTYLHFIFVLGGLTADGQLSNSVERYDTMFNLWEAMAPMPTAVLHPAVAAHDQRIYVFGGEDAMQKPVRIIQVYHIGRNLWYRMETRTVKNVCAPAAVIDDKIYIVGGYTRRMVAYDVKSNRFEKCENMKARKMHHSAAVVNGKIYVTGGRFINSDESVEDSDGFDFYDPKTDSWVSMGTLPFKLFDHGSVNLVYLSDKFLPT
ncbi:kelch-like protein 38 [Pimephales promelas]|uniref:kelch-like protein 38 n=1 Tax=Pimephales promelas TaxID=90988 RepID=UPI0019557AC3|nr:kelch-like protein 38 [Pimephales promelas]KAG1947541.1 kelch-like protein 24 isoform b [Pimephales promelas]